MAGRGCRLRRRRNTHGGVRKQGARFLYTSLSRLMNEQHTAVFMLSPADQNSGGRWYVVANTWRVLSVGSIRVRQVVMSINS